MRIVGGVIALVVALDGVVMAFTFWPLSGSLLVISTVGIAVYLFRNSKNNQPGSEDDWVIGQGIELTDPNRPTKSIVSFSANVLKLGVLCFGQQGSGKTESFCLGFVDYIRNKQGKGLAYFEGKGDLDIAQKYIANSGEPDFFFSTELDNSHSLNLFDGEAIDVVDRLSQMLIGDTASTSFYSDEQYAVLGRLIPVLKQVGVETSLRDLYVTLTNDQAAREVIRRARANGCDIESISLAEQWLSQAAADRLRNISGLLTRLFTFVYGAHTDRLNTYSPDLRIADAIANNQSIYFHLPYTRYSVSVAIALMETFAVEAKRRQLSGGQGYDLYPLLFDDWGKFIHENFAPFMARCRSASMPALFSFQSIGQTKEVSHTFVDQIDDLSTTKIFLRLQGDSTSRFASSLLGDYESVDVSITSGSGTSARLAVMDKPRVEARDFRELSDGEAFVSTQAQHNGKTTNPLLRVRFPLLDFKDWENCSLPDVKNKTPGEGLDLFGRYLNPQKLKEIQEAIINDLKNESVDDSEDSAIDESALKGNRGFDPDLIKAFS